MSEKEQFIIISVTGAHSKVGKTTLCSLLLKDLKGFGAIKFTKTPLYTAVIEDTQTIMQNDKDTAIMAGSGAGKVVWIKSPREGLEDALNLALYKMEGLKGVVVEGNSPVDFLNPHLVIFLVGEDGYIKPSASNVCKRADIIVINSEKQIEDPAFLAPVMKKETAIFRIDLLNKEGEIDKFLAYTQKYINEIH
jgi:molybdopterin-guanine dinucleotide biosynthesis protein